MNFCFNASYENRQKGGVMPKFEWSEALSVKVASFDDEHKKLIEMIGNLQAAMAQGQARTLVPGLLADLANYTRTHFKNEESYMVKLNYPAYEGHKRHHDEFITKVKDMIEDHKKGNLTLSIAIGNFLTDWITTHIQKVDMAYSDFMNSNDVK